MIKSILQEQCFQDKSEFDFCINFLLNNITDPVFIIEIKENKKHKIFNVNKSACKTLGYTKNNLLNIDPQNIYGINHKELIKRLKKTNKINYENRLRDINNQKYIFKMVSKLFMLNNKMYSIDIAKKKIKNKIHNNKLKKDLILALTKLLELYDTYTNGHSQKVAKLCVDISKEMNLSYSYTKDIYWAAMIHDIGKILVPLEILNKNEPLTREEYEEIKLHPIWGYMVLQGSPRLKHIGSYVKHHHERWDGTGYPDQLKKDSIPLASQIISVADAWDAMTSIRAYRNAYPKDYALNQIKINSGTQFSPDVTNVFLKMFNL